MYQDPAAFIVAGGAIIALLIFVGGSAISGCLTFKYASKSRLGIRAGEYVNGTNSMLVVLAIALTLTQGAIMLGFDNLNVGRDPDVIETLDAMNNTVTEVTFATYKGREMRDFNYISAGLLFVGLVYWACQMTGKNNGLKNFIRALAWLWGVLAYFVGVQSEAFFIFVGLFFLFAHGNLIVLLLGAKGMFSRRWRWVWSLSIIGTYNIVVCTWIAITSVQWPVISDQWIFAVVTMGSGLILMVVAAIATSYKLKDVHDNDPKNPKYFFMFRDDAIVDY